jgi:lysophospholipase
MRRLWPVSFLILMLAGCGVWGDRAAVTETRAPASLTPRFFPPQGWAWGLLQAGEAPAQRYGVAAPPGVSRAQVLILPGYGESAEAWFETAQNLTAMGDTVWVLERAGQGGSGRYAGPRDLGHVPTFDDDVAITRALAVSYIPRDPRQPLIVIGQGAGAIVALQAAEAGMPVDGLVLSAADFSPPAQPREADWPTRLGLTAVRAPGAYAWRKSGPDAFGLKQTHDARRGSIPLAWQIANPDLRMGGPSIGWLTAATAANESAQGRAGTVGAPVVMLSPGEDSRAESAARTRICHALPHCAEQRLEGARPALHLEADAYRAPWLAAIRAFTQERTTALSPLPARKPPGPVQLHAPAS